MRRVFIGVLAVALIMTAAAREASAQSFGVKGGAVFADFSADAVKFDKRTGWQAGLFVGAGGPVGILGELNIIQKRARLVGLQNVDLSATYLQVPVLLRISGGNNGARVYGIVGPSIDVRVGDSIGDLDLTDDDVFRNYDVGLVAGAGVQFAHILVEGRYTRGLRRVNKFDFDNAVKLNVHSFAVLAGVGF